MNADLTYFDFSQFGGPDCFGISALERDLIWQGAQAMMAERGADQATLEMREIVRGRLLQQASRDQITADWFANALLVMALDGIIDGTVPRVHLNH